MNLLWCSDFSCADVYVSCSKIILHLSDQHKVGHTLMPESDFDMSEHYADH